MSSKGWLCSNFNLCRIGGKRLKVGADGLAIETTADEFRQRNLWSHASLRGTPRVVMPTRPAVQTEGVVSRRKR